MSLNTLHYKPILISLLYKQMLLCERVVTTQQPFLDRAAIYLEDKAQVLNILEEGKEKTIEEAERSLRLIHKLMGLEAIKRLSTPSK